MIIFASYLKRTGIESLGVSREEVFICKRNRLWITMVKSSTKVDQEREPI